MKTKHTPAPWLYQPGRDSRPPYVIRGSEGGFVVVGMTADRQEADAALIAAAPELLAEIEREYIELADFTNDWPGRDSMKGQMKLGRLRDLIAKATGRSEQDVQDDYGTRAAGAKAKDARPRHNAGLPCAASFPMSPAEYLARRLREDDEDLQDLMDRDMGG